MKRIFSVACLFAAFAAAAYGAGSGPAIQIIDKKVSIQAEAIPLSRLLRLLDRATGMTSKVPAELANRNISVRFSGLNFDDAVRKIFEGQPFDYAVIQGQGIVVTALSQQGGVETASGSSYNPPAGQPGVPAPPAFNPNQIQTPFGPVNPAQPQAPGMAGAPGTAGDPNNGNPGNGAAQPAVIQTPFGTIPNPNARTTPAPMVGPGQQPAGNPQNGTLGGTLGSPLPTFGSSPTGNQTSPSAPPFGFPSTTSPRPIP